MSVVLVVDDDPDVRFVARAILRSAGYTVVEADSGAAALEQLDRDGTPDALLLDVKMPGLDGWQVLERLRADPAHHKVPVVIFTGHIEARAEAPAKWRDYEHFITKPFKPDELLGAVEAAIAYCGQTGCATLP